MELTELRSAIGNRIKKYREETGISRDDLATRLSTNAANLGNIERGEQFPTMIQLRQIASISGFSYDYWIAGEYENKNYVENESGGQELTTKYGKSNASALELNSSLVMYVPLVDQYAHAGYLRGFSDTEKLKELPQLPWVVDREYKGNYTAFEVSGDSMDDGTSASYIAGDILLCRQVAPELWVNSKLHIRQWDFVIVHKTEGIVVKRVIEHDVEKGSIKLHSLNDQYPDYVVKLKDVLQIFNVVRVQRKK